VNQAARALTCPPGRGEVQVRLERPAARPATHRGRPAPTGAAAPRAGAPPSRGCSRPSPCFRRSGDGGEIDPYGLPYQKQRSSWRRSSKAGAIQASTVPGSSCPRSQHRSRAWTTTGRRFSSPVTSQPFRHDEVHFFRQFDRLHVALSTWIGRGSRSPRRCAWRAPRYAYAQRHRPPAPPPAPRTRSGCRCRPDVKHGASRDDHGGDGLTERLAPDASNSIGSWPSRFQ